MGLAVFCEGLREAFLGAGELGGSLSKPWVLSLTKPWVLSLTKPF